MKIAKAITIAALVASAAFARQHAVRQTTQPVQTVQGPSYLALNIHNCGDNCASDDLPFVDQLQPTAIRVGPAYPTSSLDAMLTGIHERGIIVLGSAGNVDPNGSDGRYLPPQEYLQGFKDTISAFPWLEYIQGPNEPGNFNGIDPVTVVRNYLKPARRIVDAENVRRDQENKTLPSDRQLPHLKFVSSPFFGTGTGVQETRLAIKAGMEKYVDIVAVHLYGSPDDAIANARAYRQMTKLPIWVTETGASGYENHENWYWNVMPSIEKELGGRSWKGTPQLQFWYDLALAEPYSLLQYENNQCCTIVPTSKLFDELVIRTR